MLYITINLPYCANMIFFFFSNFSINIFCRFQFELNCSIYPVIELMSNTNEYFHYFLLDFNS